MIEQNSNSRIAVLITCHNRRESTLTCLDALHSQELPKSTFFDVYLVDDGSTDGTGDAVRELYPRINVLSGDGSLYWCGGMRLAWDEAFKADYEYYLWLNDDTLLYPDALNVLLETAHTVLELKNKFSVIAGMVCDPQTGLRTYGGVRLVKNLGTISFIPVELCDDHPVRCSTFNGNLVLIPREVANRVGNISSAFTHGIGDYDYGLRAMKNGFGCWVAPGIVGTCGRHPLKGSLKDSNAPVQERLRKMLRPTGLPPAKEWMIFTRRHGGLLWPFYWAKTLVRVAFPRLWIWLRAERAQ